MGKKITFYLNAIHYCYYRAVFKLHLFTNKINPFRLIHKLPFQKRRYEQLGIDIDKEINKAFQDKQQGIGVTIAGGVLLGLLFFFFFGLFGTAIKFLMDESLTMFHFLTFGLLAAVTCYFSVFRNDKYLKYFEEFEKWSPKEKSTYTWFTILTTIGVAGLWLLSF